MSEATLTSKGQVTIPKEVRDALGLAAGDRVAFVDTADGVLLVPAKGDIRELRGMFRGRRKKPLSIEEMNELISRMGRDS